MSNKKSISPSIPIVHLVEIFNNVKSNVNINELTVSIRQHCISHNQHEFKNKYLQFFLHCQTKIKYQCDMEWKYVVQKQINKMEALEKLLISIKKLWFNRLAQPQSKINNDSGRQILCDIKTEISEFDNITVAQDIKTKTFYFFLWCEYLKAQRKKKIQKVKQFHFTEKSIHFYSHSKKYAYFSSWKELTKESIKKMKRGELIERNCRKRTLRKVFGQVKDKIQIATIEHSLTQFVQERLIKLQKKIFFVNLKKNRISTKSIQNQFKIPKNIWSFRFCTFLTQKMSKLKNRSSKEVQKTFENQYQLSSLKTAFRGLKSLAQINQDKKKKNISFLLKNTLKKSFRNGLIKSKTQSKKGKLQIELKIKKLQAFFHNSREKNQFLCQFSEKTTLIQKIIKERLQSKTIISLNLMNKRQGLFQQKCRNLHSKSLNERLKIFFKRVKKIEIIKKEQKAKELLIKEIIFFKSLKSYFNQNKSKKQIRYLMSQFNQKKVLKNYFNKIKLNIKVKLMERQMLQRIFFKKTEFTMKNSLYQIFKKSQKYHKMEYFIIVSQKIVKKNSFILILNKMISSKIKINNFIKKFTQNQKRMIFSLLESNINYVNTKICQIYKIRDKYSQINFYKILNKKRIFDRKRQFLYQRIKNNCKLLFKSVILMKSKDKKIHQTKKGKVVSSFKKNIFTIFKQSINQQISLKQKECSKIIDLQTFFFHNSFKIWKFKTNKLGSQKVEINQKQMKSIQKIVSMKINRFKQNTQIKKKHKRNVVNNKIKMIQEILKNSFISRLLLLHKKNVIKTGLRKFQKQELFEIMKKSKSLKKNQFTCKRIVSQRIINNFQEFCISEKENRDETIFKLQNFIHQKQTQKFIYLTKKNYLEQKNYNRLLTRILKIEFALFFKYNLKDKFNHIKRNAAVKKYAKKLKQKSFKSIKALFTSNILKQNRLRSEFNSKQSLGKSLITSNKKNRLLQTIERFNISRVKNIPR